MWQGVGEMLNVKVGKRIQQRLKELDMTQVALADATDFRVAHINDLIHGRHAVSLVGAVRIADALKCSLDWLVGRNDTPK